MSTLILPDRTTGSIVKNSLLHETDRLPAVPRRTVRGNTPDSVMRAPIVTIANNQVQFARLDLNATVDILLFGQDAPIVAAIDSFITGAAIQAVDGVGAPIAGDFCVFPNTTYYRDDVYNTDEFSQFAVVTTGARYQAQTGTVNGVTRVTGFPLQATITDPAAGLLLDDPGGIAVTSFQRSWFQCITRESMGYGEGLYINQGGTAGFTDVLLDAAVYVQGFKDAGDLITGLGNNFGFPAATQFRIVGLFHETPAP